MVARRLYDYEFVAYQRDVETNLAPVELKQVHPLGKSPVIEDDGLMIESAQLSSTCANVTGARTGCLLRMAKHIRHLEWMQFGESSTVPAMLKIYAGRLGEGCWSCDEQMAAHIDTPTEHIGRLHFVGSD